MKDYLIIIHKVTMPWIYVCHKLQFDLVQYWATNWTMYTLCNACNGESPWRWWTWGGFLVNFGWIWHPSSFGVCVGQRREGNFDQFQYLPILTIGPRQSTHPSLENFQETRAGWILKRNFFLLRGTFLFCSSFCSAVGVSSSNNFSNWISSHIVDQPQHLPLAFVRPQLASARERELFKREGSIYPSIHLICHPQSNSWNM